MLMICQQQNLPSDTSMPWFSGVVLFTFLGLKSTMKHKNCVSLDVPQDLFKRLASQMSPFSLQVPKSFRMEGCTQWIVIQGFHSWFLLGIIWLQKLVIFQFVYLKQNLIHNYFDLRHIFCIFPHMKTFPFFFPVKSTAKWLNRLWFLPNLSLAMQSP